eukprot:4499542-Heterocapsa_arctica.AAC.1
MLNGRADGLEDVARWWLMVRPMTEGVMQARQPLKQFDAHQLRQPQELRRQDERSIVNVIAEMCAGNVDGLRLDHHLLCHMVDHQRAMQAEANIIPLQVPCHGPLGRSR